MKPELVHVATSLLQARVDGKLNTQNDLFARLHTGPDGIPARLIPELQAFIMDLKGADNIPGAQAVAKKYGLEIVT
jgi:hypothetical protein